MYEKENRPTAYIHPMDTHLVCVDHDVMNTGIGAIP